jgi:pyruvate/2-oxoglutarate dehydrogenase complex dihydrolipoamide acyltransferase (E2) component
MSDERVEVKIEEPGDTVEVEVIAVMVDVGASVRRGDVLLEIATDKANQDIEAPVDGVVAELGVAEGDIIGVDRVLVVLST